MVGVSGQIVVNGRFLQRPVTGVERFAIETLRALDLRIAQGLQKPVFVLAVPPGTEPAVSFAHIPVQAVGRHQGHLWEQLDLALFSRGRSLLNLCNTAPMFKREQAVVIHDAGVFSVPQAFSAGFRLAYKVIHRGLVRSGAQILTVSEFSRSDLLRHLPFAQDRIQVLPESAEHMLHAKADPSVLVRAGLQARPYVLAVSSMAAHKNFRLVLDAIATLDAPPFDVAIAGGANAKVFGTAGQVQSDHIKWLGYVSDAELRALYEGAMCFVFPSVYEGFGIPPLEAMQCGCPVLAARAASIPEVCGDAALYFDPQDSRALAALLMKVAQDPSLRARMGQQGRARAQQFTWARAAQALSDAWLSPRGAT
jgi:glycosyltransferase involved in cell wall biosynthesis